MMNREQKAVTDSRTVAGKFEVKRMLEPEGTRYGIYRNGALFEAGFHARANAEHYAEVYRQAEAI